MIPGNHYDVYDLENQLGKMLEEIRKSKIRTDGLFLNADADFDVENLRNYCLANYIFANMILTTETSRIEKKFWIKNCTKEDL